MNNSGFYPVGVDFKEMFPPEKDELFVCPECGEAVYGEYHSLGEHLVCDSKYCLAKALCKYTERSEIEYFLNAHGVLLDEQEGVEWSVLENGLEDELVDWLAFEWELKKINN